MTSNLFAFDWFIRTRTVHELSKRSNTLLTLLTREYEAPESMKKKRGRVTTREDTPSSYNGNGTVTPVISVPQSEDHIEKKARLHQE